MNMDKHAWFHSIDASKEPSKVIVLPVREYCLRNGMTSKEMCEYCRLYSQLRAEDEG